jgi:16S rRNA (guanine527-N7)-methyltransferase
MADVSRETPSTPDAARRAFPSARLKLAERYVELLATDGVVRGLIGPREAPRLWERHLLNCAAVAEMVPEGSSVCDVGSGAGLPGVVLAITRPDLEVELVEPLLRRTTFLAETVAALDLANVTVTRGRAEDLHGVRRFDVVTSRAVAPLPRLLGWSMPLVAPEGVLLGMKGSSVAGEIEDARKALADLGCAPPEILEIGDSDALSTTRVVRVRWADPTQVSWPERAGSPKRHRRPSRSRASSKRRRPS